MHGDKNYPFRKEKSDWDIALPDGTDDTTYLEILQDSLRRLLDEQQPDFVFYLSGVDVLATDKLGRLGMTLMGCKERDRMVMEACYQRQIPMQCSMGGGYSESLKIIIEAHANTYRTAYELFV